MLILVIPEEDLLFAFAFTSASDQATSNDTNQVSSPDHHNNFPSLKSRINPKSADRKS